ncbi:MAG: single-stranded DNA-binding protein, partial [Desulfuromonadales bacterium]
VGLTLRVGRAVLGGIDLVRDLIETGQSILILGRPGVGKTTKLRETARVLADEVHKRVIVIDTSNEIAGDGDIPHPGIGSARRMQVPRVDRQHAVMIEAVENHMPEVIIVDEIGTEAEAAAARTIAERGVQLIGTAHGTTLENLIKNPTLADLVGGVQVVTLSDEEARRRRTPKTVSERRAPPTFGIVVEMVDREEVIVHRDTAAAVDAILSGSAPRGEQREQGADGQVHVRDKEPAVSATPPPSARELAHRRGPARIYPYALSRDLLERVIRSLGLDARTVGGPEQADLILALRSRSDDLRLKRIAESGGVSLQFIKRNTANEMRRLLERIFHLMGGMDEEDGLAAVVRETEEGIRRAMEEQVAVALAPQRPALRKMQHRLIAGHGLVAESTGREPERHLVIRPPEEE